MLKRSQLSSSGASNLFLLLLLLLPLLLLTRPAEGGLDAMEAAEISREIRNHFRASGMNWVSPKMMKEGIDLATNTKPIMYLFTMRS